LDDHWKPGGPGPRSLDVGVFVTPIADFSTVAPSRTTPFDEPLEASRGNPIVINAGAVGQPVTAPAGRLLRLTLTEQTVRANFERVAYDLAAHIAAVRAAKLPSATIERLVRFFA